MTAAFRLVVRTAGGPEVLEREPLGGLNPGRGEALIRHEAVGVNFIDTYHRSGLYPVALPSGLGSEAAGVVEAVGEGVGDIQAGDRVGYFTGPLGAYATHRLLAADLLVRLADGTDAETAAAALLKGCTAEYLIERCARIDPGETVLVHAAAGGVGSILVQWLKAIGAKVIAHSGSARKAELASQSGADHSLCCPMEALAAEVRSLTDGRGVETVLDGVGAASWEASLASVARRGMLVTFGNASGPVPPFTALDLVKAGSIYVTRPSIGDYAVTRAEMQASAERLFGMIGSGAIKVAVGARYGLDQAGEAHKALEARATTGSILLIP
jgi:NADPH:quinone reductase